ncbi:MAG: hypothetical protein QXN37_03325 [Candidatus Anstonellaceae archaeon]
MRYVPALLLVLLYGCITSPVPNNCQGLPQEKFANCIYIEAVSDQNPNLCYHIADLGQRKICLQDAIEPSAKAALSKALPSEKEAIFVPQAKDQTQQSGSLREEQPQLSKQPCEDKVGIQKDECINELAIAQSNMKKCKEIEEWSIRQICISNIAKKTRNLSLCNEFDPNTLDADLCKFHAVAT